jgi:hypothetical protein
LSNGTERTRAHGRQGTRAKRDCILISMSDEFDELNDPLDDELDGAVLVASQLIEHVKRIQSDELELPIIDESSLWLVTIKRMGIRADV